MNNIEKLYENYPVLAKINEKNKGIISDNIIFKTLQDGELMTSYENICVAFLFIVSGTISVSIRRLNNEDEETYLYNIGKGEICHEALSCILNYEPLSLVGKAIENSEVFILPMEIVNNYLVNNLDFTQYIYKDLYKKFNKIVSKKEENKYDSLETRLVKLLLEKNSNIIYTTHSELAFELDSAREVVGRKLKVLEKQGYITRERGKIRVLDKLNDLRNTINT